MASQFSKTYGKAKLEILVNGCTKCGGIGSSAWFVAKTVPGEIDGKAVKLEILICADCAGETSEEVEVQCQ